MRQLIKVERNDAGASVVSARELYDFLEVVTPFYRWSERMFAYGFTESVDYQRLDKNVQTPNGGSKLVLDDYALTLDAAKEIAMLQRSDKGKQARQYFIECEKKLNAVRKLPGDYLSALEALIENERGRLKLQAENEELKPDAAYTREVLESRSNMTTTIIAKELGMSAKALNKILVEQRIQYYVDGQYVLYSQYQDKGYASNRTYQYSDGSGDTRTTHYLVWTEAGRKFIHQLLNKRLIIYQNTAISAVA